MKNCAQEPDLLETGDSTGDLLEEIPGEELTEVLEKSLHVYGNYVVCKTDARAEKRSRTEIVLDATDGFVPLWEEGSVLWWRFNQASLNRYRRPEAIKTAVRRLLGDAILAWGDAAPIRFAEKTTTPDFEIVIMPRPECNSQGCVLAEAFFPDAGRHQLLIFPTMFQQSRQEQIDTLAHEIGHVFGLRHFFAPEQEVEWPSVLFGEHVPFSIMNYGNLSHLTDTDRRDLKALYRSVWSGQLTEINGTPIKRIRPYHYTVA